MKKNIPFVLISFIICTSFNNGTILLSDYRDEYLGNYFCTSRCQVLNSEHSAINTRIDTRTISVTKDPLDSILKIGIGTKTYQVKLKNNLLYAYPSGNHWGGKFYERDSISFVLSASKAPNACRYNGKRR
ncbi:MAG: hypothetical protein ACT4ON_10330 [Bacteroidota bacterium]